MMQPDEQDIATVRDVLRTFGGRHVCAAFDRIVSSVMPCAVPTRPPPLPPTQADLTAALRANARSGYEPEPVESEE